MVSDIKHATSFNKIKYLTPFLFSHAFIHILIDVWCCLHLSVSKTIHQRNLYFMCSLQPVISASVIFTKSQFCRFTYDWIGNTNMRQTTKLKTSATPCHSRCIHPSPFPTNTWKKTQPTKNKLFYSVFKRLTNLRFGTPKTRARTSTFIFMSAPTTLKWNCVGRFFLPLLLINGCCVYILHTEHCPSEAKGCILPALNFHTIWWLHEPACH